MPEVKGIIVVMDDNSIRVIKNQDTAKEIMSAAAKKTRLNHDAYLGYVGAKSLPASLTGGPIKSYIPE